MEISIKLPNNLYQDISLLAKTKKTSVATIIKNAVRSAVYEEDEPEEILINPLKNCTDVEVLALAKMKMSEAENNRMSGLLEKQREETITPLEQNELAALFRVFQVENLRKAQGISEAVQRGIIKTPDDLL